MSTSATPPSDLDSALANTIRLLQTRAEDVLNAIDDGVFFLDHEGRTIFVNEAASRMLGFTSREMLGKHMHELTHHHYADGTEFPWEACPIAGSVHDGVQQRVGGDSFWKKNGEQFPVDYTSIPIKDGREIVGVVVTFRDISDQQRVEEQALRLKGEREARAEAEGAREALRASEARYRFLAEAIPVQIWTADADGKLDYVTKRVSEYFGVPEEQVLRDGWQEIVHPDDLPGVGARWMHSVSTGEPYEVEFRLRGATGVYRWHLARALAQFGEDGRVVKWYGTNTEIEEQRSVR